MCSIAPKVILLLLSVTYLFESFHIQRPYDRAKSESFGLSMSLSVIDSEAKEETPYECIRFRGGGIYFWWQAGAARYLNEHADDKLGNLPLYGTSAGSLTATLYGAKVKDLAYSIINWKMTVNHHEFYMQYTIGFLF